MMPVWAIQAGFAALLVVGLAGFWFRPRLLRARADAAALRSSLAAAQSDLVRHQTLYRLVTRDAACAVIELNSDRQPVRVSGGASDLLRLDPADLLTGHAAKRVHPEDRLVWQDILSHPSSQTVVCRAHQTDGRLVWLEVHCRTMPDGNGAVIMLRDISAQKLREEHLADALNRLERVAMNDPLTGLLNRPGFLGEVDHLLTIQPFLAILFVDLDRFKPVNDAHGHAIGDAVLREAGARIARAMGPDATTARLSADEFAAAWPVDGTDLEVAARGRDILRALSETMTLAGLTLDVGATIGIAVSPRDGRSASSLLRAADIALAYAKSAGGGCYRFFEARMSEALQAETELKTELRAAIGSGEIEPYFQPLVRMRDTAVVGFEVLARWVHPRRGLLAPDRFLPLVAELGLSTEMFVAQLERVCATASAWPSGIRLSLNLSPGELQNEALPDVVRSVLDRTGFDGSRLEVEITEEALVHDLKVARGVLDGLRALGMTVSLDDFGTGFSSLYHLRELPFDKVKIDKSFMRALDTDADSARYVAAIIGLCHALGLEMTAEGIEDAPTLQRLRELGCTYGQGYLFGHAVPASEASRVLESNGWPALAAE